jgi:hypothetical protein
VQYFRQDRDAKEFLDTPDITESDAERRHSKNHPNNALSRRSKPNGLHKVQRPNTQRTDIILCRRGRAPGHPAATDRGNGDNELQRSKTGYTRRQHKTHEVDPAKLLKGTTVHLSNSPSRFFVVMGSELPLSGVDNTWFWIVQETGQNATVLLWAGANCLHIESTKTHGYRDVLVRWSVAAGTKTDIYKFDGTSYKLRRTHWHENKP